MVDDEEGEGEGSSRKCKKVAVPTKARPLCYTATCAAPCHIWHTCSHPTSLSTARISISCPFWSMSRRTSCTLMPAMRSLRLSPSCRSGTCVQVRTGWPKMQNALQWPDALRQGYGCNLGPLTTNSSSNKEDPGAASSSVLNSTLHAGLLCFPFVRANSSRAETDFGSPGVNWMNTRLRCFSMAAVRVQCCTAMWPALGGKPSRWSHTLEFLPGAVCVALAVGAAGGAAIPTHLR